jgi:hypothetical protein
MRILRAILNFFYEILFGCRHDKLTRPFTLDQQTYMVCLDCGKQIYYSVEFMAPLSAREVRRLKAAQAGGMKLMPMGNRTSLVSEHAKNTSAAA